MVVISLGLDNIIKSMNPKRKKLFETIITIGLILTLLYGALTFLSSYTNIIDFLGSPSFYICLIVCLFLFIAWKFLHGAKLNPPDQQQTKKVEFNMPNQWGIKSMKDQQKDNNQNDQKKV